AGACRSGSPVWRGRRSCRCSGPSPSTSPAAIRAVGAPKAESSASGRRRLAGSDPPWARRDRFPRGTGCRRDRATVAGGRGTGRGSGPRRLASAGDCPHCLAMADGDRERWDARWRAATGRAEPSPFLVALDAMLPRAGAALDVAGGAGRNGVWLARRGLDVVCADVSPVGLVVALRTMAVDLETEPLPPGPFELIVAIDFLHRPLLTAVPDALAAGGLFVMAQPTRTNLTRNAHP